MPPKLPLDCAISFRQDNPKKPGCKAHTRYEQYKKAKTVDEALKLGADKADLNHDLKAGYLVTMAAVALVPTPVNAPIPQSDGATDGAKKRPEAAADLDGVCAKRRAVTFDEQQPQKELQENQPPQFLPNSEQTQKAPSSAHPSLMHDSAAPGLRSEVQEQSGTACGSPNRHGGQERPPANSQPSAPSSDAASGLVSGGESAAASAKRKPESDVDLSFATFDNKPLKFIKRTMGEAKRLLCNQGVEEGRKLGYEFKILERTSLAKWAVQLRDLNSEGDLAKDLQKMGLDASVDLEFSLPDAFPLEPPFVRVVYPQLSGAYVFPHGGICFEPLTSKGWAPSMTLPNLAVAIKGILDYGGVRCSGAGDRIQRKVRHFTEEGARKDHKMISSVHRDGKSNTYAALSRYTS